MRWRMIHARTQLSSSLLMAASLATSTAFAEAPPAAAPSAVAAADSAPSLPHRMGLGYKVGNGLGFVGGELVVGLLPRLAVGLQANYISVAAADDRTAKGFGIAPFVTGRLHDPGSTPYLSVGYVYAALSLGDVKSNASGTFANLGWEWTWRSGLALALGGGVSYLGDIEATDGLITVRRKGGVHANLEASLRYMFF